ncbi:MAG: DUF116 domain-containing protein [Candidatus Sumerlaeaceae bacterium]|nr:DUF116 domain-containing protein [Candidatus Sumerlaeaceae bacterium]
MVQHKFEQNLTDRKLGHEWYEWDGDIDAHEGFIREPKRLAILLATAELIVFAGLGGAFIWAVKPRLDAIQPAIVPVMGLLLACVSAAGLAALGVVASAIVFGWPLQLAERIVHAFFVRVQWLERFARLFGISKDRLGYSLIEVHNALSARRRRIASNGRILCLAPRCIERSNIDEIRAVAAAFDCDFYVAPNGALARQKIVQLKPAAIIGIACERDLVTGIRDVGYRLPVLGIANKRPVGPCKGPFIDIEELRRAIITFRQQLGLAPEPVSTSVNSRPTEVVQAL